MCSPGRVGEVTKHVVSQVCFTGAKAILLSLLVVLGLSQTEGYSPYGHQKQVLQYFSAPKKSVPSQQAPACLYGTIGAIDGFMVNRALILLDSGSVSLYRSSAIGLQEVLGSGYVMLCTTMHSEMHRLMTPSDVSHLDCVSLAEHTFFSTVKG